MTIKRKLIGIVEQYKGRNICARFIGPDLLAYVNDIELGGFFLDRTAALDACKRHIDAEDKAIQDTEAKASKK